MAFNIPKIEEEILAFWKERDIFRKSLEKLSSRGDYVFYDGPPFATGLPHYGHIVASLMKDMVPRFWTMRGYHVERRWGWDCHGLPIENIVEQELGMKHKRDIIAYGVDNFNESCRSKVMLYREEWRKTIERFARWADMDNDYKTMDASFMESVWWVFKSLWEKGLIYEGYKSMHICPRCETTLSQSEVTEGYKTITDQSVIVKFKVKGDRGNMGNRGDVYLLAWTTTPWTLPGNLAVAVNPEVDYKILTVEDCDVPELSLRKGDSIIIADNIETVVRVLGGPLGYGPLPHEGDYQWANVNYFGKGNLLFKNITTFKGNELVGLSYQPLFSYYKKNRTHRSDMSNMNWDNAWKVYAGDFVSTEEGTGIVHIAPAFGEDDMKLGQREHLPFVQHVTLDGRFTDEVKDFAGLEVKPKRNPRETDEQIVSFLKDKGLLFTSEHYEHSYPHCWRCETPLLNYATSSWFVAVTKIKQELLEQAKSITWKPEHMKDGRFGNWLEGAKDWAISRQRFWGSVLPIWKCEGRGERGDKGNGGYGDDKGNKSDKTDRSDTSYKTYMSDRSDKANTLHTLNKGGCGKIVVIGSIKELEELSGQKVTDLHKHIIDPITFPCPECGGMMRRIPDVLDCWFESGSMPYAQQHYPFENKEKIECIDSFDRFGRLKPSALRLRLEEVVSKSNHKLRTGSSTRPSSDSGLAQDDNVRRCHFPAQFIAEGADQTRAWFYYLHVLAIALWGKASFQNVIVNGIVLAEDGRKMSKRLKNYPEPEKIFNTYGADAMRYYLATSPVMRAEDLRFSEKGVEEVVKKVVLILLNVLQFYKTFADKGDQGNQGEGLKEGREHVLDRWIMAKLNELVDEVTGGYESYDLNRAARPIEDFVNELSTWYVRRSRDRFKGGDKGNQGDSERAVATLRYVLMELSKLIAPVMPFLSEYIYKEVGGRYESVHLETWSQLTTHNSQLTTEVLGKMEMVRKIVEMALAKRAEAGVPVRQPLGKLTTHNSQRTTLEEDYIQLIKDEVNVKEVVMEDRGNQENMVVELETELTPELRREGIKRELVRQVNALRKTARLTIKDRIYLFIGAEDATVRECLKHYVDDIVRNTLADQWLDAMEDFDQEARVVVGGSEVVVRIKKIDEG